MKKIRIQIFTIFILFFVITANRVFAEKNGIDSESNKNQETIPLTLHIGDLPFNIRKGYRAPSMHQALYLSSAYTNILHTGLGQTIESVSSPWVSYPSIICLDIFILPSLPLGRTWIHEEYHRAVLSRYAIDSYNEVYDFNINSSFTAVSHVSDESLMDLKANHPADLVRLAAAGYEGQTELVHLNQREYFFSGQDYYYLLFDWWYNFLSISAYVYYSGKTLAKKEIKLLNEREATIKERDIVGFDFSSWVYDLYRPYESYTERGVHPSGTGIDRYRSPEDLTDSEKNYLQKQAKLSLINFVSPQLFGISKITWPFDSGKEDTIYWNFYLSHFLTSFGYTIDTNVMIKTGTHKFLFAVHQYRNKNLILPGLEGQLYRKPVKFLQTSFNISLKAIVWLQPKEQNFYTKKAELGGLVETGIASPITDSWEWTTSLYYKAKGWVVSYENLNSELGCRFGINYLFN